jgi:hypothetical protein
LEVSGQLHAPAALPPGKSPRYPLYRRLGGPQSRSGQHEEEKILDPTGTRTSTSQSSSPQPVAIPIALSRLMKRSMYWDITPRILLEVKRRFGRTYRLNVHGQRISQARNQYGTYSSKLNTEATCSSETLF